MTTSSETTLVAALPNGTPSSFGVLVASFERLMGYVDSSAAPVGSRIVWKLYATSGGVRALVAVTAPIPSQATPYTIFTEPDTSLGVVGKGGPLIGGFQVVAGTQYEIVAIPQDGALTNIRAGFVGYHIETNTSPNEVAAVAAAPVFNTEVNYGSLANHHVRLQVQIDPLAASNYQGQVRVYGTITGAAGNITALIATANVSNQVSDPTLSIDAIGLGWITAQARFFSTNPSVAGGNVNMAIVGADVQFDSAGGANGNTVVFQPNGVNNGNIFNTWAATWAAAQNAIAQSDFVNVGFDGSLNAGVCTIPAGVYDFVGKGRIFAATNAAFTNIVFAPNAQFKSLQIIDTLQLANSPAAIIPCLTWDPNVCPSCYLENSPFFTNVTNSGAPFATFTGTAFTMFAPGGVGLGNGAVGVSGPIFAIPNGGTLGLSLAQMGMFNSVTIGTAGFTTGAAGTTLIINADTSFGPALYQQSAAWLGATTFTSFGKISRTQTFTANGNFTVPLGVTEVELQGCGGGGGGAGGNAGAAGAIEAAGGGGGGALLQTVVLTGLTPLQVIAVTIGAGGASGAAGPAAGPSSPGGNGTQTTFGALAAFDGGSGGGATTAVLVGGFGGMPYPGQTASTQLLDTTSVVAPNTTSLFNAAGGRGGGGAVSPSAGARNGGLFAGGTVSANQANAASGGGGGAGPFGAGAAGGAATAGAGGAGASAAANTGAGAGGGAGGNGVGNAGGAGGVGGSGLLKVTWRLSP